MSLNIGKRDPRAKFVELANARVSRAVKDLRLISNLSNRKNYEYSDEEAKRILKILEAELDVLRMKFKPSQPQSKDLFKL